MRIEGDYSADGYATVRELVPREVATNLFRQIQLDLEASGHSFQSFAQAHALTPRATVEISGHFYRPLTTFLWGLTPILCELTGADLLPSYDYFRIYHQGDICRVHADRPSCEHSVSLTLAYSDGIAWPLEVGSRPRHQHRGSDTRFRRRAVCVGRDAAGRCGPLSRHGPASRTHAAQSQPLVGASFPVLG